MDFDDVLVPDRFLPPRAGSVRRGAIARCVIQIALVILAVVAFKGYFWYTGDVARHETLAAGHEPEGTVVSRPVEVQGLTQQSAHAPTNKPASALPGNISAAAVELGNISDSGQRRAVCGYLAAELERLNHDFKQPLPPPVIDHIATEIAQVGEQVSRYGCASSKGLRGTNPGTGAKG